jgi:NADH-quinone oxidoreductase subunit L
MATTLILLTIGLPWLGALLVWTVGDDKPKLQHNLAVIFSVSAGIAALALLGATSDKNQLVFYIGGPFGDFTFLPDGLGVFLAAVATVIGSLAMIFSVDYMRGEAQLGRYYGFALFFIGSMVGLVLASNLLLVFVFWEITALCSYALISFNNDDPKAVAGGMKALIITQLGGIGLLIGALVLYAYTGSYDIPAFLAAPDKLPAGVLGLMAFGCLVAAAAKSAQFPFQTWLPDAMEAPTPISALIHAATMVNAGVYLLARFYPAFEGVFFWREAVMIVGVTSALLTAVMALYATDLKRVLAYSTVSQLGYMVYAVGAGSLFASQFHLLSHAVFKALLFLAAGAVIHGVGTRDMRQMGGLGAKMPLVRNVFIIGALALAGFPPLNGFWSKELVLEAGLKAGESSTLLYTLYILMLIGAGLTALYTIRCVWMVFFGEMRSHLHVHDAGPAMKTALVPLALGTLTTWLLAGPFAAFLKGTLPFHEVHVLPTLEILGEVISLPTLVALCVILFGLALWFLREHLEFIAGLFSWLGDAAIASFGFEAINSSIVRSTQDTAEELRDSQTGLLNWNIFAIVAALVIIIILFAMGA